MDMMSRLRAALGGQYTLERELGTGATAVVFLARDTKHGRDVALKALRPDVAYSLAAERFLREIRLAARLTHPHILPLYDSGEADGVLYFAMPVVVGRTLRDHLRDTGPLPVDEAIRLTGEIADALDYAHRQQVVHRDVKPENILLHEGHAVVADFGIGKALHAATEESGTFTQVGVAVGTAAYMSPEQAAGEEVDGRSDLFSLGCMLYEMLLGELPFVGPTLQATIAKRFHHVPPAVSSVRPVVPAWLGDLVAHLLEKAPEDRPASGASVARALRSGVALGPRREETPSVAVLPFASVGADPDNQTFADGVTDDIIGALTRVHGLKVAARASAFAFRGADVDLTAVGSRLGVRHALQGSVRRAGNRVRVAVQLMTVDGTQRWSDRYDRDLDDIFAIQDEIAQAIVGELSVVLGLREGAALVVPPTDDVQAYELYLRGREAIRLRTPTNLQRGIEGFERAIARDRGFTRAWLGLVEAHVAAAAYGYAAPSACRRAAAAALAEAAALRGSAADVALHRAFMKMYLGPDWPSAGADLDVVLADRPSDVLGNLLAASWHGLMGRESARTAAATRAISADPLSPFAHSIAAHSYHYTGAWEDALALHERALALDANALNALWGAATCLVRLGRASESLPLYRRAVDVSEGAPTMVALLAFGLHAAGRMEEARTLADDITDRFAAHPYASLIATIRLGDEARLAAALEHAVAMDVAVPSLSTTVRPELGALLDHPRLGPLVRRLNLYAGMPEVVAAGA